MKLFSALFVFILSTTSLYASEDISSLKDLPPITENAVRVLFIRHAEAVSNTQHDENLTAEQLDRLTEKGIQQAKAIGETLKDIPVFKTYCSETHRTLETIVESGIAEKNQTKPEQVSAFNAMKLGKKEDGTPATFADAIQIWQEGKVARFEGGESYQQAITRVMEHIRREDDAQGKTIVVVTHSDIIAGVAGAAEWVPVWQRWEKFRPGLASITVIDVIENHPLVLRLFNYTGHL